MKPFTRICLIGRSKLGRLFVTIKWDGRKLSLTGVEGPLYNGDCRGGCGQCFPAADETADNWTPKAVSRLREYWDRWHLNDTRAGCAHQRETWNPNKELELVELTWGPQSKRPSARIKPAGWVLPEEHPEGLLTKPCPVCGHRYGSSWLYEEVPEEVLAWLEALPDATEEMPAVWRK